ncbi:MAG: hypothetical protein AAF958_04615 [Planctomycetota bacterium]
MTRLARVGLRSYRLYKLSQRFPGAAACREIRESVVRKSARRKCVSFLAGQQVVSGPFKGLRYAETASVGSMIWPKLAGTYESELQPCLREIADRDYQAVIDVGYAEGFYLLGLGRWFENAELIGFDLEAEAERQCRGNAEVNGIASQRLRLFGGFDAGQFQENLRDKTLVVVDCEGFENDVIEGVTEQQAARADWLIETHDHLVPGTTQRMTARLRHTHHIELIHTDAGFADKCKLLPSALRDQCSREEQEAIVTEGRVEPQSWVFATRRAA